MPLMGLLALIPGFKERQEKNADYKKKESPSNTGNEEANSFQNILEGTRPLRVDFDY
jgi:hypothetical protein